MSPESCGDEGLAGQLSITTDKPRLLGGDEQPHYAPATLAHAAFEKQGHSRFFNLVWLIYTVFFFIEPIHRNTPGYWAGFVLVYLIFLALYLASFQACSRRTGLLLMAAMGALGLIYYPFNSGASGIFIYVAALTPFVAESTAISISVIVAAACAEVLEGMLLHGGPWSWGITGFLCFAIGAGNLVASIQTRTNRKLHLAHEEIAHLAQVAERERIARDLHDVLGHTLSVVVLKSELAGKLMEQNPARARKEIAEVEQIARAALGEVRQAIRGYRSEGLAAELDRARATLDAAGVTLECSSCPPKLQMADETVLSLIVREAVTNIVRHARASQCRMDFQEDTERTALIVEDNGCGGVSLEGNGIRGMRERAESLGGRLRIESAQGTRLIVEIPGASLREA